MDRPDDGESKSAGLGRSWRSPMGNAPAWSHSRCSAMSRPSAVPANAAAERGLDGLLEPPQRPVRPARISPPPAGSDRRIGLPGADCQGLAHHPLDEPGSGPPSGRRRDRPGHQRSNGPDILERGGPPAASHAVLADVSDRRRFKERAEKILWCYTNADAVGPAGLSGWSVPTRSPTSRSWNDIRAGHAIPGSIEQREFDYTRHGTVIILVFLIVHSGRMEAVCFDDKSAGRYVQELSAFRARHRHLRGVYLIHDNDPTHTAAKTSD